MAAANKDDGVIGRNGIQIAAQGQALLPELGFMPIAVGDHDFAFWSGGDAGLQRVKDVGQRASGGEVDAWAAAGGVQMTVFEARDYSAALQIDHPCGGTGQFADAGAFAGGGELVAAHGEGFDGGGPRIHREDFAVDVDGVGSLREQSGGAQREEGGEFHVVH